MYVYMLYCESQNQQTNQLVRLLALVLLLQRRQREELADALAQLLPAPDITVLVPREDAHPRLHVVVHLERDLVRLGDLARRVRDLVLGLLVLEREYASVEHRVWLD